MKKYTWIKATAIRALKTLAQTAIATIGTGALLVAVIAEDRGRKL